MSLGVESIEGDERALIIVGATRRRVFAGGEDTSDGDVDGGDERGRLEMYWEVEVVEDVAKGGGNGGGRNVY